MIDKQDNAIDKEQVILEKAIKKALDRLYKDDYYLICNNLHELCVNFRFGIYLYNELMKSGYDDYDLDSEYNCIKDQIKVLPSWQNGARPDFILHKRGYNGSISNILILELKKRKNINITEKDKKKISELKNNPYFYKYGATILLMPNDYEIKWV